MNESRIPPFTDGTSKNAAPGWLAALHKESLLFCLDDDSKDIVLMSDGSRMFLDKEAEEIASIYDLVILKLGDTLHEFAFDTLGRAFHAKAERRAFRTMYG